MKFLNEPLVHFLVIGAVLFGGYRLLGPGGGAAPDEIVVSTGRIASMAATFAQTWQRPPTPKELDALVNEHIHDEVLYRQGVAMGLDKDDAVIRRRIRQKMEFVADLASDVEPTDKELEAFVAKHPDWFRTEPRFSFDQVYFSGGKVAGDAVVKLIHDLDAGTVEASDAGDPFMAGAQFQDLSRSTVAQTFGETFAAAIEAAAPGSWLGPVMSGYGTHLVRVTGRVEPREPPFEQIRQAARREWLHEKKEAANDALYEKLRSNYVITVEAAPNGAVEARRAEVAP